MVQKKDILLRHFYNCILILFISFSVSCGGSHNSDDVDNINNAPITNDDLISTNEGPSVTINVLSNDNDPDNDLLKITSVSNPANGTVVNNGTDVLYTPDAGYHGTDSFTYIVSDGHGGIDNAEVTVTVEPAIEEIFLEDNFPGYAEKNDWDDHWTMGIGELGYHSDNPGFVRLLLAGPGVGGIYHNAEKKHFGESGEGFLYCDLEIRLRNSNNNGWDAPGAPETPNSEYGLGSRGWGLWNDQLELAGANVIWFTSISPESASIFRGTRVWIICNGTPVLMQDLNIDLTQWHIYRIKWHEDYIGIFIDDMINPITEVTNLKYIPNEALSFTVWTDNYCFLGDMTNPIINYMPVQDIEQYIDIDYVKIIK